MLFYTFPEHFILLVTLAMIMSWIVSHLPMQCNVSVAPTVSATPLVRDVEPMGPLVSVAAILASVVHRQETLNLTRLQKSCFF